MDNFPPVHASRLRYSVPNRRNIRLFSRSGELQKLKELLDSSLHPDTLRAVGIYGIGGVGKSRLALQYAAMSRDTYQIIAWIPAGSLREIVQSPSRLALKLGISTEMDSSPQSMYTARDWLDSTKRTFLLIFDNVEDVELLEKI